MRKLTLKYNTVMKIYKVTNVFYFMDGSTYPYDCGIFASESIAKMVAKALESYNATHVSLVEKTYQVNHRDDDPESPCFRSEFDLEHIEVVLEEFELIEDKESIEAQFAKLQQHLEKTEAALEADLESAMVEYDKKHKGE